jgi:tetratricopeptide (TPR) repeat protein
MDQTSSSLILHQKAIDAALDSRWEEALLLNQQIIEIDEKNIDALNRIARAHFELGDLIEAKKYYNEALKFDQYNPIALKNIKIIQAFKEGDGIRIKGANHQTRVSSSIFLQEPGRTKVVNLLKVAEPQKLSLAYCGMAVELTPKQRGITVTDQEGAYLGVLPDDTAHQLLRLIKGGNKYCAFVKSIKVNGISILIKETFRSAKFRNQPSFLEFTGTLPPPTEMLTHLGNLEKEPEEDLIPVDEEE